VRAADCAERLPEVGVPERLTALGGHCCSEDGSRGGTWTRGADVGEGSVGRERRPEQDHLPEHPAGSSSDSAARRTSPVW
jgi:hypothetical protein